MIYNLDLDITFIRRSMEVLGILCYILQVRLHRWVLLDGIFSNMAEFHRGNVDLIGVK